MHIALVLSSLDPAGQTVKAALLSRFGAKVTNFKFDGEVVHELPLPSKHSLRLYTISREPVHAEEIDSAIHADLLIFATRHASKKGVPMLSVHAPGNWGAAELGGRPRQLGIAPASLLKACFAALATQHPAGYDVVLECTHHGPYLEKPAMFIELGSSERNWLDQAAATAIANALHSALSTEAPKSTVAVGLGGPHHCPNFRKIALGTDIAFSHICASWALSFLDHTMLEQALSRSTEPASLVIVDWKGLGSAPERERIIEILRHTGIEWTKTDRF